MDEQTRTYTVTITDKDAGTVLRSDDVVMWPSLGLSAVLDNLYDEVITEELHERGESYDDRRNRDHVRAARMLGLAHRIVGYSLADQDVINELSGLAFGDNTDAEVREAMLSKFGLGHDSPLWRAMVMAYRYANDD